MSYLKTYIQLMVKLFGFNGLFFIKRHTNLVVKKIMKRKNIINEIECTIIGNPDWKRLQKILEEQVSKDIAAGKLNLDFIRKNVD